MEDFVETRLRKLLRATLRTMRTTSDTWYEFSMASCRIHLLSMRRYIYHI